MMLYDYQQSMLQRIREALVEPSDEGRQSGRETAVEMGQSIMVQMPTGTGKTFLMAAVIKTLNMKGEIYVIAHRRELVEQMKETLRRFEIPFSDDKTIEEWRPVKVRVMSVQWLSRNLERMKTLLGQISQLTPGLLIIDEAHHSLAASYQSFWNAFPQAVKLGFTATPCRLKKESFTTLWHTLLTSWNIKEFIQKRYLALYDYVVINKDSEEQRIIDHLEKRGADGDYAVTEMADKLNSHKAIERLYQSVETYARGKKGIVYAINIAHAKSIATYYTERGLRAVAIDSRTPAVQRSQWVEDFRRGTLDCLVNVNLFDEGFDCPDVEFIQMARPTLSLSKYMQMVGRGLRIHPGKKMCVLMDNVGLYRLFGLPDRERDWQAMFTGEMSGRGDLNRLRRVRKYKIDNEMEIVVSHSALLPRSQTEAERYYNNAEPFEKGGRWGLKVGNTIILRPIYMAITPFVGKYCTFELLPGQWGVLCRNGRMFTPAIFKKIELLPDGDAIMTRSEISRRKVHLDTTFRNKKDIWEWWGELNVKDGGYYFI